MSRARLAVVDADTPRPRRMTKRDLQLRLRACERCIELIRDFVEEIWAENVVLRRELGKMRATRVARGARRGF